MQALIKISDTNTVPHNLKEKKTLLKFREDKFYSWFLCFCFK